jgi:Predicted transcriptional regulators
MSDLQVEYVPVGSIKPYENNARRHGDEDVEAIAESIREFGFDDPIGVWHNVIVTGHGRYAAAKKLKMKRVPIIRLDHLTDDQRKAYALAHNKTAELSSWDYDMLDMEINDISLDMELFGFELEDSEYEHEKQQEIVQGRVEKILGLEKAQFPGVGKYDMPQLAPVKDVGEIKEWIGFNYVLSDKDPEGKAVHFFIDDYQFERIWKEPEKYADKLRKYRCVATPDFSPYADMPLALQIYNHYRKQWVGAYLQANGVTVIPTVRASRDERSLEWYLEGLPVGGVVIISNMWTKTEDAAGYFMREYEGMMDGLKPSKVFVYGKKMDLDGNVEFVDTFAKKRWEDRNG